MKAIAILPACSALFGAWIGWAHVVNGASPDPEPEAIRRKRKALAWCSTSMMVLGSAAAAMCWALL